MIEFYGTPNVETESWDGISHHPRWKGLQMKELIRKTWDGSSLELHHKSRISQLHPWVEFINRTLLCTSSVKQCSIINIIHTVLTTKRDRFYKTCGTPKSQFNHQMPIFRFEKLGYYNIQNLQKQQRNKTVRMLKTGMWWQVIL